LTAIIFLLIIGLLSGGFVLSTRLLDFFVSFITANFNIAVIALSPADVLLTILKLDFLLIFIVILPFLISWFVFYIRPALYAHERGVLSYIPLMYLFSMLGLFFGWLLSVKVFIPYFYKFAELINIHNSWSIDNLIAFIVLNCIISVVIFQVPILVVVLHRFGLIKLNKLTELRKVVILIAVIFGALFTPPDVASQMLVAIPFYLLFELTIQYCRFKEKFFKKP
jgi:sec-independent protein translocase protein TatC